MIPAVIFFGGCFGAVFRMLFGVWQHNLVGTGSSPMAQYFAMMHIGTLMANLCAAFIYGFASGIIPHLRQLREIHRHVLHRGVGVGFCGGFSTMSTLALETWLNMTDTGVWSGLLYMVVSLTLGCVVALIADKLASICVLKYLVQEEMEGVL